MTVSAIHRPLLLLALLVSMIIAAPARADRMFTVTDLGSSYTLQQDASGAVHSVTSGDGSQSYAFEKSLTTPINVRYWSQDGVEIPTLGKWNYSNLFGGGYVVGTLQNGSLVGGYYTESPSGYNQVSDVPFGFYFAGSWHNEMASPVSDMNSHGEIVGTSMLGLYSTDTYAAFSTPTGGPHDPDGTSRVADNLNNYIASSLGVNLTSTVKVDDLGDIIAEGTLNGKTQEFLLTLNGSPTPAPEPSTLALLTVGITALVARAARRKN